MNGPPREAEQQNVVLVSVTEENGNTKATFRRKLDTGDAKDRKIMVCSYTFSEKFSFHSLSILLFTALYAANSVVIRTPLSILHRVLITHIFNVLIFSELYFELPIGNLMNRVTPFPYTTHLLSFVDVCSADLAFSSRVQAMWHYPRF